MRTPTPNLSFAAGRALCALIAFLTVGCSTPIASGLDESEANRVMLALDRAQVASSKESDAASEGKFRVVIASDDAAKALVALRAEELPRRRSATMAEAAQKGGLVPSPAAEQAQLAVGIAGELERSLENIDGVLSARVHLSLPSSEPLREGPRERASASVLIVHRGTTQPVNEAAVQRLVSGGAPSLAASDVAVVMVPRSVASERTEEGMARLGPFGVARSSLRPIQLTLAGLLVGLAVLAGLLVSMASRHARLAAADADKAKAR